MAMTPAEFYTQKGLDEGMKQGLDEGMKQGLNEGMKQGLHEGMKQGRAAAAKRFLIKFGTKRFGMPTEAELEKINKIQDPENLAQLCDQIDEVKGWSELIKY